MKRPLGQTYVSARFRVMPKQRPGDGSAITRLLKSIARKTRLNIAPASQWIAQGGIVEVPSGPYFVGESGPEMFA